ncbi:MAG: DUF1800 family protein [Verrucomicrobiales bacterium]|nr:DUF1800 family protein [Verrucomicrobiales bacterium]
MTPSSSPTVQRSDFSPTRHDPWHLQRFIHGILVASAALAAATSAVAQSPAITSILLQNNALVISVDAPAGFRHAVLESGSQVLQANRESLAAGGLDGRSALITFTVPDPKATTFLRIRLGTDAAIPAATYTGAQFVSVDYNGGSFGPLTAAEKTGHLLNRIAYGPSPEDLQSVQTLGLAAYLEQQLAPATLDESSNTNLTSRVEALFTVHQPTEERRLISSGDTWRYLKGTAAPPLDWKDPGFADSFWAEGPSGFGYGDEDDATVLSDMRQTATNPGYLTVFLRKKFTIDSTADIDGLVLRFDFDDGFVAYLNGTEIARENVTGNPPAFNAVASGDHEAGSPVDYDVSAHKSLLRAGENVIAIEVHNIALNSSDLSAIPELLSRKALPIPAQKRINGIEALQHLIHVRGIYSRRQLQAVLGEFWENHFTTDFDKVTGYFGDLRNSDARMAMTADQADAEAAQAEFTEYQFFYDNALGNFGDLLLYSATSPSQLIYLDNVLNVKGAANENYAREILELFAFGVDNRYTQTDIEQLARCFTGWSIRKIWPQDKKAFPASARTPPTDSSVQFQDDVVLDLGAGWKYLKGTKEPAPGTNGVATTAWANPDFNDSAWTAGSTGIGYGDNDDATTLTDMRNNYVSVYLRRAFTVSDPEALSNLLLSVDYDDGFVAYLNGTEIARSETMQDTGTPPPFNRASNGSHEAGDQADSFSLAEFRSLLKPAPQKNVLAIQVHNISADSSDLSLLPRLVNRRLLPGSIENGDANGVWTFRFNPDRHDTGEKILFAGTPHETKVPAGRTGIDGLKDAVEVIDSFVNHPSVSEFICLKLINKFVSDEISLRTYHDGTAPAELRALMEEAIAAWKSTQPAGNIATVLRAILKPATLDGQFWSRTTYRSKVKTPVEYINSSARALRTSVAGSNLPAENDALGMHLFTRDDPDGWSESGIDWIDTGTLLARIQFAQDLPGNRVNNVRWDVAAWITANGLTTAESIVEYFNQLLYQGAMSASNRELLIRFATTDDTGNPLALDPARADYGTRVRELVGLILSMPQWHYQ